ncbi:BamA/TamA family outer membrane protein [Xanthomarina spongicola]|uniref:Surface antigen-like protein n=1 Tax=Xanthomarina spongicola TaxID=570520 RepID=A0A316DI75_9FLAO|nr:BamA/TamA family outer membrane protein [Xanthomarina spongicola]PWK17585.1 surface antigen-like protein [Xanthomarina spongicola]
MKKTVFFILICLFIIPNSFGQNKDDVIKSDTINKKNKKIQLVAFPIVFYTPETSFGFGAGGQIFLLNQKNIYNDRVSNVFVDFIMTSKKQFILDVIPQIYFGKGDYFLDMNFKWKIFPNDFWGIGNTTPNSNLESYDMTSQILKVSFLKRLPPDLNFGFEYIYENHDVTKVEEGGLLSTGEILGSDGAVISGFGIIFNLDSRNNVGSPTSGHLLKMNAQFSSELFGATETYNKFIADLRTYQKISNKSIVALQLLYEGNYGNAPFQGLAWYGGGNKTRGYYQGRYIDNSLYLIQAEYRYRFKPRFALAGFGLFGKVASDQKQLFSLNDLKPSAGGGLRFKLLKNQDTWVRLDAGIGIDGSSGIYFGVNEAF